MKLLVPELLSPTVLPHRTPLLHSPTVYIPVSPYISLYPRVRIYGEAVRGGDEFWYLSFY